MLDAGGRRASVVTGNESPFERALCSLHAAALDDARWLAASGLIDQACGLKGQGLVVGRDVPQDGVDLSFTRFCFGGRRNEELERLYFGTYHAVDERLPRLRRLPEGELVHVSQLYTDEEKKSSVAYNEVLALGHSRDSLNVRLDGPEGSRIVWSPADPVDAEGWSSARVGTVRRLLPHLRQYVRVRQALVDARALGASAIELLENRRLGIIRLDRRARVLEANDRACAILRGENGLLYRDGHLKASLREDDAALQRLLAQALPQLGGPGAGGSMFVHAAESPARLMLHVSPVGGETPAEGGSRIGALVLVADADGRGSYDPDRLGALLGLTRAESHVAALLAEGMTVGEIAAGRGRSVASIRFHLKHIFVQYGLTRQVELVELVRRLADLDPALRR